MTKPDPSKKPSTAPSPANPLTVAATFAMGFVVLVVLLFGGALVGSGLGLPIPPAIIGMVLLLGLLGLAGDRVGLANTVETASMPLLKHMMLFFIPAVAGVMEQFAVLKAGWLAFVVASIAGAALTLAVTALTLQWLLARQRSGR